MYIGGVDVSRVRVAPGVEEDAGFQGCISEVREPVYCWCTDIVVY